MPKWLQGMVGPTLALWFCLIAAGITVAVAADGEFSWRADLAYRIAFPLVMAQWVLADARKRGRRTCYDFDTFVFFAWPVLVPVYLFQTRGFRAFGTLLCFVGLIGVSLIAAFLTLLIRG